mgnify:CR=1 FL=1
MRRVGRSLTAVQRRIEGIFPWHYSRARGWLAGLRMGLTDAVGPCTSRAARFAAEAKAAAEAAAAEDSSEEGGKEFASSTEED